MDPAVLSASVIKQTMKFPDEEAIPDRFQRIVTETFSHNLGWMLSSDNDRFRVACAVLLTSYPEDSDERERIQGELNLLKTLNAMMSGIPVDMERAMEGNPNPIGLMKIFKDYAKEEEEARQKIYDEALGKRTE